MAGSLDKPWRRAENAPRQDLHEDLHAIVHGWQVVVDESDDRRLGCCSPDRDAATEYGSHQKAEDVG
jgi:hypothetical protein